VPAIKETQEFVENILTNWSRLVGLGDAVGVDRPQRPLDRLPSRTATVASF
jgi:hypothetical protein